MYGEATPWDAYLKNRSELEYLQTNTLTKDFMSTEFEEIGHVFDNRYLVEGRLGKGGMATVYLVSDTFRRTGGLESHSH